MKRIIPIFITIALLAGIILSSGCAVYDVAVEERNVGDYANDEKITLIIKKEFLEDDMVKYMDFDAATYEGHVYILGEYENHAQVERAVKIAKGVEGVRKVTTYILPKKADDPACGTMDNFDLYRRVTMRLVDDKQIWSTNIDVKTIQCNVILLGIVADQKTKDAAYTHATATPGAKSVKSFLTIKR